MKILEKVTQVLFKHFCDRMYTAYLGIYCFQTQHNNLGQNLKVAVITLLSRLEKNYVYHPFVTTSF